MGELLSLYRACHRAAAPAGRHRRDRWLAAAVLATGALYAPLASSAEAETRTNDDPAPRGAPYTLRAETELWHDFVTANTPRYTSLGVGGALELGAGAVELASGVRLALGAIDPNPGVSLFVRASACAATTGWWQPAVGLEVELTSATRPDPDGEVGSFDRRHAAANRSNHLRAAALTSLLRFRGERMFVAAGMLRLGTALSAEVGRRVYLGIGIVNLGWRF